MPSNSNRKTFKPKNVLKPKPQKKIIKQDKNKENTVINAQIKQQPKFTKKAKSCIPKPSLKPTGIKNPRKGEYQKYMADSKERERTIPSKVSSRKSSLGAVAPKPPKKDAVSKTESLYHQARMALGKTKKPQAKPVEIAKPPLQKRKSEAVLEVLRKQEKIRKNMTHRNSFHNESSRNAKKSSMHNDRQSFRHSQERFGNKKLNMKKSHVTIQSSENEEKEPKQVKPSMISRKEARARIGLADIPDEKIEELVKVKKTKMKQVGVKNQPKPSGNPVPNFQYQKARSRMSNEPRVSATVSIESGRHTISTGKESLKLKQAVPEAQRISIVKAQIPE